VVCKKSCFQLMIFVYFSIQKILIPALTVPLLSHLTSCTPTKSHLYLANSLAVAVSEPALYRLRTFQVQNLMYFFRCLGRTTVSVWVRVLKGQFYYLKLNPASIYTLNLIFPNFSLQSVNPVNPKS